MAPVTSRKMKSCWGVPPPQTEPAAKEKTLAREPGLLGACFSPKSASVLVLLTPYGCSGEGRRRSQLLARGRRVTGRSHSLARKLIWGRRFLLSFPDLV